MRERIGAPPPAPTSVGHGADQRRALDALRQQCSGMEALLAQLRLERLSPAGRMAPRYVGELYATLGVVESIVTRAARATRTAVE